MSSDEGMPEQREDGRRERILRAAIEVFASRGYHQALLDDVAKAAGVGKGTIYLYVPDKEGLLLEAIRHQMEVHERHLHERVQATKDTIDKLYQLIYLDFQHLLNNVELAKVLLAERAALGFSPEFQASMATMRKRRKELLVDVMNEGQAKGVLRADARPDKLALAFTGIIGGPVFDILFDEGPRIDPEGAAQCYLDFFLSGCGDPQLRSRKSS